jgi:hypothetical protein
MVSTIKKRNMAFWLFLSTRIIPKLCGRLTCPLVMPGFKLGCGSSQAMDPVGGFVGMTLAKVLMADFLPDVKPGI